MSGKKDSEIKLFGKTIQVKQGTNLEEDVAIASRIEPSDVAPSKTQDDRECSAPDTILCSEQSKNRGNERSSSSSSSSSSSEEEEDQEEERSSSSGLEECKSSPTSPRTTSSNDKECSSSKKEDQCDQANNTNGTTKSQDQNPPKKPDKILPCPRCNSMDTKFCYFNNYNVNQPRHFCKNCQRYWTAGGTMRNMPVGAGRRKSKCSPSPSSSAPHRHPIVIPECTLRHDGTILAFGPESRLSESISSSLSLVEKPSNRVPSGFIVGPEMRVPIPLGGFSRDGKENSNSLLNASTWPCAWNQIPWQSGFPVSFYSGAPDWAANARWGAWDTRMPRAPTACIDEASTTTSPSTPTSPNLGKHSRDGTMLGNLGRIDGDAEEKRSGSPRVVVPRTSRIEDLNDVAKSSMWSSLGIKGDKASPPKGGGWFFRGLHELKSAENNGRIGAIGDASSMVLEANPAAFSRSLTFHEIAQ